MSIRDRIYRSPTLKTAIPLGLAVAVGILSNTFVTEITQDGVVEWKSFYKSSSFYLLGAAVFLTYLFHRYLYRHERNVMNFDNDDYCRAYALSELIPVHVEEAKKAIAEGNTDRFKVAMDQIKKVKK